LVISSADPNKINGFSDAQAYANNNNNNNNNNKEEEYIEGLSGSVVVPDRRKGSVAKPIPEDWELSEDDIAYAVGKGWPMERVVSEGERFKIHFVENEAPHKNWKLVWQKWVTSPYQQQPTRTTNGKASNSREKGKSDFKDALRKLGEYAERDGGEISEEAVRLLPSARRE
jgi:hypothetical protein